jgi:hypothetical protein
MISCIVCELPPQKGIQTVALNALLIQFLGQVHKLVSRPQGHYDSTPKLMSNSLKMLSDYHYRSTE